MQIFDLVNLDPESYEKRERNVLFQNDLFKTMETVSGARLMGIQIKTRGTER